MWFSSSLRELRRENMNNSQPTRKKEQERVEADIIDNFYIFF